MIFLGSPDFRNGGPEESILEGQLDSGTGTEGCVGDFKHRH